MNFWSLVVPRFDDLAQKLAWKTAAILSAGMGLGGNDIVTDANTHSGDWWCLHAWTDCVFTSITFRSGTSTGSLAGKTLLAGDREYGNIIAFQLASGTLVATRAAIPS